MTNKKHPLDVKITAKDGKEISSLEIGIVVKAAIMELRNKINKNPDEAKILASIFMGTCGSLASLLSEDTKHVKETAQQFGFGSEHIAAMLEIVSKVGEHLPQTSMEDLENFLDKNLPNTKEILKIMGLKEDNDGNDES